MSIDRTGRIQSQSRLTAVVVVLSTFVLTGCGAGTILPPPIPGLVTIADSDSCSALAVGENEVWAALYDRTDWFESSFRLARIPLDSNLATVTPLDISGFTFGVIGADIELSPGAVWLSLHAGQPGEPVVVKIDPETGKVVGKLARRSFAFMRAAVGEDAVWIATSRDGANELLRVDPKTSTVSATTALHTTVLDIAITDGAVWVLHPDKTLSRIDAATNRVLGAIRLPVAYTSVTSSANALWLATSETPLLVASAFDGTGSTPTHIARLAPDENKIVTRIPLRGWFGTVRVADVVTEANTVWAGLLVSQPEPRTDPAQLWLAEIDVSTNELRRTTLVGRFDGPSVRIAIRDDRLFVCGPTVWRLPLEALEPASP